MKQFSKSGLSGILNTLLIFFTVTAAAFLMFVTACTVKRKPVVLFGKSVMQIVTGSMEPALHVDECVIVEQVSPEELSPGDIIAYISESDEIAGMMVMHRITECLPNGTFLTKGDANPIADALPVRPDQIHGRFLRKTPFFTWLTSFANLRKVLLLVVMCMTSCMALYEVRTIMQISRETAEERRERLIREAIDKEKQRLAEENFQPDVKERE